MSELIVMHGHLGWANTRAGVELFARQENGGSGRWGSRARYPDQKKEGDLLSDHLENAGAHEGQDVVVIVLPRGVHGADVVERIASAVDHLEAVNASGDTNPDQATTQETTEDQ